MSTDNLPARRELGMDEIARVAKAVAESGMVKDARTAAAAGTKMVVAQQLGFSPVAGLLGIDYIDGRPRLSARMLLAAVRRHPLYDYRVPHAPTRKRASVQILHRQHPRAPWEEFPTITFTEEDARLAGLSERVTYLRFPQAMLYWRAARQAVDFFAPEVSLEWGPPPDWEEVSISEVGEVEVAPPEPEPESEPEEPEPEEPELEEGVADLPADVAETATLAEIEEPPFEEEPEAMMPLTPPQVGWLMAACRKVGVSEEQRKRLMAFYSQGRSDSTKAYPITAYRNLIGLLDQGPVPDAVWAAVREWENPGQMEIPS